MAGLWQVCIPQADINLITNPSGETNLTGYTAGSGSLSRSQTKTRWGAYSIAYTPGSGTTDGFYWARSLTNGQVYTLSIYFNGEAGVPYALEFADNSGTGVGTPTTFTGDGAWHRYSVTYTAAATATHRLRVRKAGSSSTAILYTDGWMCVAASELSTYIDGDQPGCVWSGTKHASTSSRSADYRGGGVIRNLDSYNAYILGAQGYGMPPLENIALDYGILPGAAYQRTRVRPRLLTLMAQAMGTSLANLHAVRDALIGVFDPDASSVQAPLQLRYTGGGKTRILKVLLDTGLDGGELEGFNEKIPLRLIAHDPYFYEDGESSAVLQQGTFTSNRIAQRSPAGAWSGLGGGADGDVYAIAYDPIRNVYYVGGNFANIGGVAATRIAKYDPSTATWSAMGSGCNALVATIVVDPLNGDVYAGGAFTSAGGVANTNRVAKWSGAAWSALGTGASSDQVEALAFDASHNLWATGGFNDLSGVANTLRLGVWNGSAWSARGTGLSGRGRALLFRADGFMYVAGDFATANGVTVNGLTYWNGTTFVLMGSNGLGVGQLGYSLANGLDGTLYVGGSFSAPGGVSCNNIAGWNGFTFFPLGTGVDNIVRSMAMTLDGELWAGGLFATAGGLALPDSAAKWNGSNWFLTDVDLPGTPTGGGGTQIVYAIVVAPDGTLTIGHTEAGTAKIGTVATVTNTGTSPAHPRLIITGPTTGSSRIYSLTNYTVNAAIFFLASLVINAGEVMVLDLTPGNKSFVSTFQGDVFGRIQPGSNMGTWRLLKGENQVSLLTADATVTASLVWTDRHRSADGGAA